MSRAEPLEIGGKVPFVALCNGRKPARPARAFAVFPSQSGQAETAPLTPLWPPAARAGAVLPSEGRVHRVRHPGEVCHQGGRLRPWQSSCPKGTKYTFFRSSSAPMCLGAAPARPSLVATASTSGRAVAQMSLGRHGHRRVGHAVGQLGQGVAGAGTDHQHIQQLFGADGLRLRDRESITRRSQMRSISRIKSWALPKRVSVAAAALGDDGRHVPDSGPRTCLQRRHGPGHRYKRSRRRRTPRVSCSIFILPTRARI